MGVGRPTSKTVEASRRRAVKALFDFFDVHIEQQMKGKYKRPVRPGRVAAVRTSLSNEIIASLSSQLRWIEENHGKRYRDWTPTEHLEAAHVIERIYLRASDELQRRPGRPRRTFSTKGLIASRMYLPSKREMVRARALEKKRLHADLFRHTDQYETKNFRNESKIVRDFLSLIGLPPSHLGRLKKVLSRRRLSAARRRR